MLTHTTTATPSHATDLHEAIHTAPTAHPHITHTAPEAPHFDEVMARIELGASLPRELREEARDMDWGLFMATYAPEPTLKITHTGTTQKNWMMSEYAFDVDAMPKASPARRTSEVIEANGPVRAITRVLNIHNRYVEILKFHQVELFGQTATFIKVGHSERHFRNAWVAGFGETPEASAAAALSAGAQRIHGNM